MSDSSRHADPDEDGGVEVQLRARWPIAVPVVALALIVGVAILTSRGGDDGDGEADEVASVTTAAVDPTPADPTPSTTSATDEPTPSSTSAPTPSSTSTSTQLLRRTTSVAVEGTPRSGTLFTVTDDARVMRIDLSSGQVTRSDFSEAQQLHAHGHLLLAQGTDVTVMTHDLEVIATLSGRLLAARPGEIWTITSEAVPEGPHTILRHDDAGSVNLAVDSDVLMITGAFDGDDLLAATTGAQWRIDPSGTVSISGPDEPQLNTFMASPFSSETALTRRCEPTELICRLVITRDGTETIVADDIFATFRAELSDSGRFLLTVGSSGTRLRDLSGDGEGLAFEAQRGDRWAIGADLIVRAENRDVIIIDPIEGTLTRFEAPRDALIRTRPPIYLAAA